MTMTQLVPKVPLYTVSETPKRPVRTTRKEHYAYTRPVSETPKRPVRTTGQPRQSNGVRVSETPKRLVRTTGIDGNNKNSWCRRPLSCTRSLLHGRCQRPRKCRYVQQ